MWCARYQMSRRCTRSAIRLLPSASVIFRPRRGRCVKNKYIEFLVKCYMDDRWSAEYHASAFAKLDSFVQYIMLLCSTTVVSAIIIICHLLTYLLTMIKSMKGLTDTQHKSFLCYFALWSQTMGSAPAWTPLRLGPHTHVIGLRWQLKALKFY